MCVLICVCVCVLTVSVNALVDGSVCMLLVNIVTVVPVKLTACKRLVSILKCAVMCLMLSETLNSSY